MNEIRTDSGILAFDGRVVECFSSNTDFGARFHIALLSGLTLTKAVIGGGHRVRVELTEGQFYAYDLGGDSLNDAEAFIGEVNMAITRLKAGKA